MKLNNIYNRNDFVKLNEIIGGTKGGVGDSDGFANNAKLKDTLLGQLLNGIFKGIGWLWRKAKEAFMINRLNAQLINELTRGVILFCFDNQINLQTGKLNKSAEEIKSNDEEVKKPETEEPGEAGDVGEIKSEEKPNIDEINKEIKKLTEILGQDNRDYLAVKNRIKMEQKNLGTLTGKAAELKKKQIAKLQNDLAARGQSIRENSAELKKLKDQKAQLEGSAKPAAPEFNLEKIKQACKNKYDFSPSAENLPTDAKSLDAPTYQEFADKFSRIKSNVILIGNVYSVVVKNKIKNIKIKDVDPSKNEIEYELVEDPGKYYKISSTKVLPAYFPSFKSMLNKAEEFLKKYAHQYENMNDEQKKKIEIIYMNYELLNSMREYQKVRILESIQYIKENLLNINEESLVNSLDQKYSSSGTAKIKPDEPKAGKVDLATSIGMKAAGISATVKDILTVRDRKKYENEPSLIGSGSTLKEHEYALDIHDVNLAEIEKSIKQLDENNSTLDVKGKVASYVNPYNVKAIQLSADQLIGSTKEGENNSLRLRWEKTVTNTYAAFHYLMNIEKIKEGVGLDNSKLRKVTDNLTTNLKNQKNVAIIENKLPLSPEKVTFSSMKNGLWCYYNFVYKGKSYSTSIAPVANAFNKRVGLFQVTSAFTDVVKDEHDIVTNPDFFKLFSSKNNDLNKTAQKINVYFLIQDGQKFPRDGRDMKIKVFVLNEYIYNNNTSELFIKKNTNDQPINVAVNNNLLTNFDKNKFIHETSTFTCAKFNDSDFENWKKSLNFESDPSSINFNDFQVGKSPKFLNDKMIDILQQLGGYLSNK